MFRRPNIEKLLQDELYQAERDILGFEERAYRYEMAARQAEASLNCTIARRNHLKAQLTRLQPEEPCKS